MRRLLTLIGMLILVTFSTVNADVQSLNNVRLSEAQNRPQYNFWVAGNVSGAVTRHTRSLYPTGGFIANLDLVNTSDARFVALLGDSFSRVTPAHADAMRNTLGKLNMPVINAIGPREQAQLKDYQANFGRFQQADFMVGPDVFLVVDSFAPNWDWLADRLSTISQTPAMRHVFIFSSRMPWGEDELLPTMPTMRPVNHPIVLPSQQAFSEQVKPQLTRLSQIKNVYWFAGNITRKHIHGNFYWKDANSSLTIVANAMTNRDSDSMINVQIDQYGIVHIIPMNTATGQIANLADYSLANWEADTLAWREAHPQMSFTTHFVNKSIEVLQSKKFAVGIFGGMVMGVIVMMIRRPATPTRRVRRPAIEPQKPTQQDEYVLLTSPKPHDLFRRLDDDSDGDDATRAA
ncbi:MAG: hypothetical protein ACF8OB_20285 [Phycisphaeraceae bacterium JB051]